jgi:hypothetical protein
MLLGRYVSRSIPEDSAFLEQTGLHDEESKNEVPQNPRLELRMGSRADAMAAADSKYCRVVDFMIYQR